MRESGRSGAHKSAIRVVDADWPVLRGLIPGHEQLEAGGEDADAIAADLALLLVGPEDRPLQGLGGFMDWKANGALAALLSRGVFVGRRGEKLLRPAEPELPFERIIMFGVGEPRDWAEGEATALAHELINCVRQVRASSVAVAWVGEGGEDEPWDRVFDALVSALSKGEVAAPGPQVSSSSAGLERLQLEGIEAEPTDGSGEAGEPRETPEPEHTREEPAPSELPEASEGEGEDAPQHRAAEAEGASGCEQWWIVAPEALCTRLRGRVLGTPRPAGSF